MTNSPSQRPLSLPALQDDSRIETVMQQGLRQRVFPGAVLLVGIRDQVLFHRAYGMANLFSHRPMTLDTFFDLASLTKPLATAMACMLLVQHGQLALDRPCVEVFPGLLGNDKKAITPRHLLSHTSGLPPWIPYYMRLRHLPVEDRSGILKKWLKTEPLGFQPGTKDDYSDLGFFLLHWLIEKICGQPIDQWLHQHIYRALNIDNLFFVDVHQPCATMDAFAATELCPWRNRLVCGHVHDDNAFVMGGIAGHAGLFGTAQAVYDVLASLLRADQGGADEELIRPDVVRTFFHRKESFRFALGFDTPSKKDSSAGKYFPADSVGHLGYSGTSFWVHRPKQLVVVLLTNRVHPSRYNTGIKPFRPLLHDTILEVVGAH